MSKTFIFGTLSLLLTLLSSPAQAVFNGQFLRGEDHLWVVRIETSEGYSCSGSLISAQWVLTAAHCLGEGMRVQVVDYPSDFDFELYQDIHKLIADYGVAQWNKHHFDFLVDERNVVDTYSQKGADVALLKLESPFTVVGKFAPVATADQAALLDGKSYALLASAGFGQNGVPGRPASERPFGMLKYYYYTTIDRSLFRIQISDSTYYETFQGFRPSLNDPDSGPGGGVAMGGPGDSGGPLLAYLDGEWRIIAVHSGGGGIRYTLYRNFSSKVELPSRARHVKVNQDYLCSLLLKSGAHHEMSGFGCP